MISRERIKAATIPVDAAIQVLHDIDDAVARRDVVMLRQFAAEAQRSGMDQESSRAFEIADVIESKSADELVRLKAGNDFAKAARSFEPSIAELLRRSDVEQMSRGSKFSVNDHEANERARAEVQNKQLAERNRRHEEQRRRQAGR